MISGLLATAIFLYRDGRKSLAFENGLLSAVYIVLPIVYILTLMHLKNALKCLIENQIDSERKSVLIQFGFFLTSYVTRLPFFLIEIFAMNDLGKNNFGWQFTTCIFYLPWSIFPIAYILWCHARTYN